MKTQLLKKIAKATSIALFATLFLVSCGKDNAVTGTNNAYQSLPGVIMSPGTVGSGTFSQATVNELQRITSQLRCQTGSSRVQVNFYTQNVGQNSTKIQGPFTKGSLPGTPSAEFIGISQFGDIMVVSKVTSGSQTAHNVSLFFCPAKNQYTGAEIIGTSTTLDGFAVDQAGIILDSNTNCASGNVDRAYTGIKSSGYMNGQQYIETFFTPYCQ
jgi:hypothetical protein